MSKGKPFQKNPSKLKLVGDVSLSSLSKPQALPKGKRHSYLLTISIPLSSSHYHHHHHTITIITIIINTQDRLCSAYRRARPSHRPWCPGCDTHLLPSRR